MANTLKDYNEMNDFIYILEYIDLNRKMVQLEICDDQSDKDMEKPFYNKKIKNQFQNGKRTNISIISKRLFTTCKKGIISY